ncbi:MAG: asparagine--tRNA ligase [Defluviitaleaceae bacterium]|nr:asparagine--tRNA ligase [Defluviitaleaceae bacterium]
MYTRLADLKRDAKKYIGMRVTVGGWIRTARDNKNFGFIEINDGSCFACVQIVADGSLAGTSYADAIKLGAGSCVTVTGTVVNSAGAKQDFEIKAESLTVEGASAPDYPMQKKRHGFEYLRTVAHLRPRTNTFAAVFRIRSLASYAVHKFFIDRGFVYVHTPIITGSDCEGAGEMFRVTTLPASAPHKNFEEDFFGKLAHLTVSGQLTVEPFALAMRDVYTFGPTFRAEHSNTPTHAAEFWMIEPEIAFADLGDNMRLAEEMTKYIINFILTEAPDEIDFLNSFVDEGLRGRLSAALKSEFMQITYTEAVGLLLKSGRDFEFPVKWGADLQTEHERYLTGEVFDRPLFIRDYPSGIKAFYMRRNDDGKTSAAMDLLAPGIGELIGGSQREERHDVLLASMKESGLDPEDYAWYLDLRRYGGVRHAGFGLGLERLVMYLTGMKNIRDVIAYPRTVNNLNF